MGLFFPLEFSRNNIDFCFIHYKTKTLIDQDGFRKHLVLSTKEVWTRVSLLSSLLQQTRSYSKIPPEHVPSMLSGIRQRHRLQEARLGLWRFLDAPVSLPPLGAIRGNGG